MCCFIIWISSFIQFDFFFLPSFRFKFLFLFFKILYPFLTLTLIISLICFLLLCFFAAMSTGKQRWTSTPLIMSSSRGKRYWHSSHGSLTTWWKTQTTNSIIPLLNVSSKILSKIMEYFCCHTLEIPKSGDGKPELSYPKRYLLGFLFICWFNR